MGLQHYRTCTLCEAMCGIAVETEADHVTSIRGDRDDPFSKGHICPKAVGLKDVHEDPDRLRTPLVRVGKEFMAIGWDEAYDRVADNLKRVQARYGRSAVGVYQGNPTVHNYGSMIFAPMFVRSLHTRNRFSATSVDQLPHMLADFLMFGHQLLFPIPDLDRTDHLLVLGANPAVSNGSLMTAPGASDRLRAIQRRGGRVVVLDPRRTETAVLADEHHFIRPGSDALFLLAVLHTLFAEKRVQPGRLTPFLAGLPEVESLVQSYSPERVSARVGIGAPEIRRIALEFAAAKRAVCYGRVGVSTQDFGALACWLVNLLNIVTGNFDREGGAMFTRPAVDLVEPPLRAAFGRGHFAAFKSRLRQLPEFGGELPVAAMAEEIDTEGKGQIRALVTSAGNPVLSTPNGARLERALAGLDFMVSIDFYLNETTRHANIILPPTGPLEHDHYDLVFHLLAVRNTSKYSPAVFPRPEQARHDWEIFNELTWRMSKGRFSRLAARASAGVLGKLGPRGMLDLLLRAGPYGDRFVPGSTRLSLRKLERAPHGIDLGALTPCLPGRLFTEHRKIVLAPEPLVSDLARLERSLAEPAAAPEKGELLLIGRRQLRSNNSWMHNSQRLVKGPVRCTLQMHPSDADSLGLEHGKVVEVSSRVGSLQAPLEVTDTLMPGVVSLPHGWGHNRKGTRLRIANEHAGASINDITDDARVDVLSGNASFSGVPVSVRAVHESRSASEQTDVGRDAQA